MALDKRDVDNIAHLARLAISEEDIPAYAENLSNILTLVEQMNAVDTSVVAALKTYIKKKTFFPVHG